EAGADEPLVRELAGAQTRDLAAVEDEAAGLAGHAPRQAEYRRPLAGAGWAAQRQDLAFLQREGEGVDQRDPADAARETDDFEDLHAGLFTSTMLTTWPLTSRPFANRRSGQRRIT